MRRRVLRPRAGERSATPERDQAAATPPPRSSTAWRPWRVDRAWHGSRAAERTVGGTRQAGGPGERPARRAPALLRVAGFSGR
ncbi:MAG: hypothetical protein P9G45_15180 [Candidatus Contendobacter sp.]|nr:hypothetical protein [Candidatus Contendobacter sp.]